MPLLEACGAPPLPESAIGRMVGDGAATLVARAFAAARHRRAARRARSLSRDLRRPAPEHTRPYPGIPELLDRLGAPRVACRADQQAARGDASGFSTGSDLARYFRAGPRRRRRRAVRAQARSGGPAHLMASAGVAPDATVLVGDSVVDWRTARAAATRVVSRALWVRVRGFSDRASSTRDDLGRRHAGGNACDL